MLSNVGGKELFMGMPYSKLKAFCSRWRLSGLVTYGSYTYTGAGGLILRLDKLPEVPEKSDGRGPFWDYPWWDCLETVNWIRLPPLRQEPIPESKPHLCQKCQGHGRIDQCQTCRMTGAITDQEGQRRWCPKCKKRRYIGSPEGELLCFICKGKGEKRTRVTFPPTYHMRVGDKNIALKYLRMIEHLPRIEIAPDATPANRPMPFFFEGGDGLIMPLVFLEREDSQFGLLPPISPDAQ
jgi:hypothetical protein